MAPHPKGRSFIQYELPVKFSKPKPKPVTTMMVGEEGSGSPPDIMTTLSLREEGGGTSGG
jgi:hypothetical protein